jgi:hypothetical protein
MKVTSVDGKIIGDIEGGVFTKRVNGKVHMLREPMAWAIDQRAYEEHVKKACHTIVIIDTENGTKYKVSTKVFDEKRVFMNRGFGPQYYLVMKWWQTIAPGQGVLI